MEGFMTKIHFDDRAEKNSQAENQVATFLGQVTTLEVKHDMRWCSFWGRTEIICLKYT